PVEVRLVMFSVPLPVLLSVTFWDALVVPTNSVANFRLVGESTTKGPPDVTPVPVTGSTCGLWGASSVIERFALSLPTRVGVNVTLTVHVACGATLAQVLVCAKSALLVPVIVTPLTFKVELPVLVTVRFKGELVVPSFWLGNASVAGDNPTF